jgi:hypothetical protein
MSLDKEQIIAAFGVLTSELSKALIWKFLEMLEINNRYWISIILFGFSSNIKDIREHAIWHFIRPYLGRYGQYLTLSTFDTTRDIVLTIKSNSLTINMIDS